MSQVMLKTHLIVSGMHEEYSVQWCGRIKDSNPILENGKPIFVIIGSERRVEMNTLDMKRIEECAKLLTYPRGKQAITTDTAYICIKETNGNEKLVGKVTHHHVKEYQQMYDPFEYIGP